MKLIKFMVWFLVIFAILFLTYIFTYETDIFLKKQGSNFKINIEIDNEELGGVITLYRDDRTPSVMDWVSFEEKSYSAYKYFSRNTNMKQKEYLYVKVPPIVERGEYHFGIKIQYDSGRVISEIKSFTIY